MHAVVATINDPNVRPSWALDSRNTVPRGITINPGAVDEIWVVDATDDAIYQYSGAASRTSDSQVADAVFNLASGNTNPQGIADPPPPLPALENESASAMALADGYFYSAAAAGKLVRPAEIETARVPWTPLERPSRDIVTNDRLWPTPSADRQTDAATLERFLRPRLPSSATDQALVDLTEYDFLADDLVADLALALSKRQ